MGFCKKFLEYKKKSTAVVASLKDYDLQKSNFTLEGEVTFLFFRFYLANPPLKTYNKTRDIPFG